MSLIAFVCLSAVAIDGDTLRCANVREARGLVRLARVDAPERGAPGSAEATRALESLIGGRTVRCQAVDADPRKRRVQPRDRYGRIVARCRVGTADLGRALIASGHAQCWPRNR